jgi:predicted HTH domain antitoxin
MWIEEALEIAMDFIEKKTHSLKRASKIWNILLNLIYDHLTRKTKSRNMGPRGVLI